MGEGGSRWTSISLTKEEYRKEIKCAPSHIDVGCGLRPDVWVTLIFIVRAMGLGCTEQVEPAVLRGKVRKCLQDNCIWTMDGSISSLLYCQYRKDSMQGGWVWSSISVFVDLGLCYVPSHFHLKLTWSPQICVAQFTTNSLFEGFLKNFLMIIEKYY